MRAKEIFNRYKDGEVDTSDIFFPRRRAFYSANDTVSRKRRTGSLWFYMTWTVAGFITVIDKIYNCFAPYRNFRFTFLLYSLSFAKFEINESCRRKPRFEDIARISRREVKGSRLEYVYGLDTRDFVDDHYRREKKIFRRVRRRRACAVTGGNGYR